jgi:ubiquinone/menaquinone biosynthesis C-methylase UbiE
MSQQRYVPAAGRAWLTGLYDPVMTVTMREGRWRPALLDEVAAKLPDAGTVVDVGAGTGSFAIALSAARPDVLVLAVDGDADVLDRARGKDGANAVEWREGLAGELPIEDEQTDAVVMSLLLHHLVPETKRGALTDAYRTLRPGGWLHVADWGRPVGAFPRAGFLALRLLDGLDGTRDHAAGRLSSLIAAAGFDDPSVWRRLSTAWGTLELLSARRPTTTDAP